MKKLSTEDSKNIQSTEDSPRKSCLYEDSKKIQSTKDSNRRYLTKTAGILSTECSKKKLSTEDSKKYKML